MSTHSICFLREIKKKCQFSGKYILVGQVDFDHLLVHGQVIKFDNSTSLPNVTFLTTDARTRTATEEPHWNGQKKNWIGCVACLKYQPFDLKMTARYRFT